MNIKHEHLCFHAASEARGRIASGPVVEEHEAIVRLGLPVLESVDNARNDNERQAAYSTLIARQRAQFIEMYGDPHGMSGESSKFVNSSKHIKTTNPAIAHDLV